MAKVVIVDDSPTETLKITQMLEKSGHDVLAAVDGESGVALVKESLPDVVLMDVVMPGLKHHRRREGGLVERLSVGRCSVGGRWHPARQLRGQPQPTRQVLLDHRRCVARFPEGRS